MGQRCWLKPLTLPASPLPPHHRRTPRPAPARLPVYHFSWAENVHRCRPPAESLPQCL